MFKLKIYSDVNYIIVEHNFHNEKFVYNWTNESWVQMSLLSDLQKKRLSEMSNKKTSPVKENEKEKKKEFRVN